MPYETPRTPQHPFLLKTTVNSPPILLSSTWRTVSHYFLLPEEWTTWRNYWHACTKPRIPSSALSAAGPPSTFGSVSIRMLPLLLPSTCTCNPVSSNFSALPPGKSSGAFVLLSSASVRALSDTSPTKWGPIPYGPPPPWPCIWPASRSTPSCSLDDRPAMPFYATSGAKFRNSVPAFRHEWFSPPTTSPFPILRGLKTPAQPITTWILGHIIKLAE